MQLLIIEDEIKTAAYLAKGLREQSFTVDVAHDGVDGLHLATEGAYDLIILDVMLPGMDGWQIVRALRAAGQATPILLLTARDAVDDRVRGLELGADDYLVKPFAFSELLARLHAVLRRGAAEQVTELRVGDLTLDAAARRVTRAHRGINLTAKEFALLWLLMRRSGEVLSRTVIAEKIWDMNFDGDTNVVDVAVRRLRLKVDAPFTQPLIHTVRGAGYVLELR